MRILIAFLLFFILISPTGAIPSQDEPVYIGVLLPLTGSEGQPLLHALELGLEQINTHGGIGGKKVSLIQRDTNTGDLETYAEDLASDPRIKVVIGPYTSDNLFSISDIFKKYQKVLVSPTASSDEIYRAFAGTGSVWRTISNDADITSIIMQHLSAHNASHIALLTPNSSYGKTFYDWIPFWAIETAISLNGADEYSDPLELPDKVRNLTVSNPDYLIFVHTGSGSDIRIVQNALDEQKIQTKLYLVHPNLDKYGLVTEKAEQRDLLGLVISGIYKINNSRVFPTQIIDDTLLVMSSPADPDFAQELNASSERAVSDFVPETYDALLVSALIMAQFIEHPDKSPMNAAITVLSNNSGTPLPRTADGISEAFQQIQKGKSPVLTGATGPLIFRSEGTDLKNPVYTTYQIKNGMIIPDQIEYQTFSKSIELDEGEYYTDITFSSDEELASGDFWAVIGALSQDWVNYRHQADALTMYQYLKGKGVPEDHIILIMYDDISTDKRNKKPGEVYHSPGIEEVRKDATLDYFGEEVHKQMIQSLFFGMDSDNGKPLLNSDENSTILLYLSSHGMADGSILIGNGTESISPEEFSVFIERMGEEKKFKEMLVILESCFSKSTVKDVTTPGVILLTASAENETSKAATYDPELSNWLSDEFTNQLIEILRRSEPEITLRDLYINVSRNVRSSHPGIVYGSTSLNTPARIFFGGGY